MRSVWTLPVDEITAADLDAFLKQGIPEGQQIDYKRAVDKSLAKSIASFANTVGGLIIFGVDTDESNQPVYPPCGVPISDWKVDSITQICSDSINPAIFPNLGPTLKNPSDKEGEHTILAVLRVDQSPLAPHAVDKSTRVPVRVKDITKSNDWADIDRIAFMLKRRERHEEFGTEALQRGLARLRRVTPDGSRAFPIVWYSVAPVFPWRPLTDIGICEEFQCDLETHRAPRGAIASKHINGTAGTQRILREVTLISIENIGAIFRGDVKCHPVQDSLFLDLHQISSDATKFFRHSQLFLRREDVLHPGLLRLSIGFENVGGHPIWYGRAPSRSMPDDSYSVEIDMSYEHFNELDFTAINPPREVANLIQQVGHGFGLRLRVDV